MTLATARNATTIPPDFLLESSERPDAWKELLGQRRIILASNRGPVQYKIDNRGELVAQRGQGGLVTSLTSVLRQTRVSWVASCMSEGDREAARRQAASPQADLLDDPLRLRLVNVPAKAYRRHYQVFANPILWFLQHSMADQLLRRSPALIREAWLWGYLPVNRAVARGVLQELGRADTVPWVFIHDYHLYPTGYLVRQQAPHALLQHFVHIPWPAPGKGLQTLGPVWQGILQGLLSNDIVGFQTEAYARNFLEDCRLSVPGARVDLYGQMVYYRGRMVRVRCYPISVDVAALRQDVSSLKVLAHRRALESLCGEKTIVQVERVDPSKNTLASLSAFCLLLERHPDLIGKVKLLAFLVPSRSSIPEYKRFGQQMMARIASINERFARGGYQPIHLFYENNYYQALAGMSLYDVLLVNPVADGMNLVAKEGPIVNQKDGVLVLSKGAGAHLQLSSGAVSVSPDDVDGAARALYQALDMPQQERRQRAHLLRSSIEAEDLTNWLSRQMGDMVLLDAGRRGPDRGSLENRLELSGTTRAGF